MHTKPNIPQLGLSYGTMTLLFSLLALAMCLGNHLILLSWG